MYAIQMHALSLSLQKKQHKSDHITLLSKNKNTPTRNSTMTMSLEEPSPYKGRPGFITGVPTLSLTSLTLAPTTVLSHIQQPPHWHLCHSLSTSVVLSIYYRPLLFVLLQRYPPDIHRAPHLTTFRSLLKYYLLGELIPALCYLKL